MAQQIKKKFIGSDQIDGSKIKLLEGQSVRATNSLGQEVDLFKIGSEDKVEVLGQEVALKSQVDTEQAAREAGDQDLQSSVDAESSRAQSAEQGLQSEIDAEEVRAQAAEQELSSSISSEEAARIAGDESLQSNIDGVEGYAQEIKSDLDQEIVDRQSAVSSEEEARIAGDASLQSQINSILSNVDPAALDSLTEVVSAFQNADSDLQESLAALSSNASSALAAEVSRAQAAEALLQSDIDTEESERVAADSALETRLGELESFGHQQIVHVSKNGLDTNSGKQHSPFLTITAAQNAILDASPSKRYVIKVAPGLYTEAIALKANVFIVGEGNKEAIRITGAVSLASDFSGSGDNRSGFHRITLVSAADFNWATVTSAAGKLYVSESVFVSTLNLYGHNNAIAQAQFNSCVVFGNMTVSGINLGVYTNCINYANVNINQHPNGGMASIFSATGGYCAGTLKLTTAVNDFNRRSSCFLRSYHCGGLVADGPSSYADYTGDSEPSSGASSLNGGNLVLMNPATLKKDLSNLVYPTAVNSPIMPANTGATNLGDWGKQWAWTFSYVHASSGSDAYLISYGSSFGADSVGRNAEVIADGAGLQANVNGGNVSLSTSTAVSGTGIRGKIILDGREIDASSKQIKNLADGSGSSDAVNKGQLDSAIASIPAVDLSPYYTKTEVDSIESGLQSQIEEEESRAISVELSLQGSIDSEMSRAMGVESSLQSEISQEVSDRISGDSALSDRVTALEADPVTKSYVDGEVSNLQSQISSVLSNIDPAALDSLTEVVAAFQSADFDIQSAITALGTSASSALAQETSDRIAADQALQSEIDTEEARAMGVEASLQTEINDLDNYAQEIRSDLDQEVLNRQAGDSALQSQLTSLEARVTENESDITTLQSQVLNLDSDVDSVVARVTANEGDIDSLETSLSSEISRATSAESALSARLNVLEAKVFGKESFSVSNVLTHVDLSREVVANSLVVFVGRIAAHKDLDYTVSVVSGMTRLTWINSFAQLGEEAILEGDSIFVTYYY